MEFVPILVLAATVKKVVDLAAYVRAGQSAPALKQLLAWLAGILVTMLAAHTAWADGLNFGDMDLGDLGIASQILAGIALGSSASLAHDAVTPVTAAPPLTADGQHRASNL